MMLKIPIHYIAEKQGFSEKSSASLGLTVCFAIMVALLEVVSDRDVYYYFGLVITLGYALLMVWVMNLEDSRVNVRKTFTATTVLLLAQCVGSAILISKDSGERILKLEIQAALTTILLVVCTIRLVRFLRNREAFEKDLGPEDEDEKT